MRTDLLEFHDVEAAEKMAYVKERIELALFPLDFKAEVGMKSLEHDSEHSCGYHHGRIWWRCHIALTHS